jgi:two-component system chemotaxis response regulator CheB
MPTAKSQEPDNFEIVAIAASAGGIGAIRKVVGVLPADFAAPILVVQHIDPRHESLMAQILQRQTSLKVSEAQQGVVIEAGHLYVAPPDRHLLVEPGGVLNLTRTELVHFVRPSADLLFESVAAGYGARAIAVVLSGSGSDGASGIQAIKQKGGTTIAQDQETSEVFGMPGAAVATGCVDFVLPLDDIGPALVTLVMRQA